MELNIQKTILTIVENALLPDEWDHSKIQFEEEEPAEQAKVLFNRWEERFLKATNNPAKFQKHLATLKLTRETALARFSPKKIQENSPLPQWAIFFEKVITQQFPVENKSFLKQLISFTEEEKELYNFDVSPVPVFPEFLLPFLQLALTQLNLTQTQKVKPAEKALSPVFRYLLVRLSRIVVRTIAYDIKQKNANLILAGDSPKSCYDNYFNQMVSSYEGFINFFESYPVLARFLSTVTLQIIESTQELYQRIQQDALQLEQQFQINKLAISSVLIGLSDPHNNGQTVAKITFQTGQKIIYKPRNGAIDLAFNQFVSWFNSKAPQNTTLKTIKVLNQHDYSWHEFLSPKDCQNKEEVRLFYQRQGHYLALFYFLCGRDFHAHNFIVAGAYPIPIDLEGLLSPGTHTLSELANIPPCYHHPALSILTSGMLPQWKKGLSERVLEVSAGISGRTKRGYAQPFPFWENLETPQLKLSYHYPKPPPENNFPVLDGKKIHAENYLPEIIKGFQRGYQTIIQQKEKLLANNSILEIFNNLETRILLRATAEYYETSYWSYSPDQVKSGSLYDIALEKLAYQANGKPIALIKDEKESILNGDIPFYYGSSSSLSLKGKSEKEYGPFFPQTVFQQMKQRIEIASEQDLNWQSQLIQSSFKMVFQPDLKLNTISLEHNTQEKSLQQAAIEIGDILKNLALEDELGIRWFDLLPMVENSKEIGYQITDPWLYRGNAGIALYLANLANLTENKEYDFLARQALKYSIETCLWFQNKKIPLPQTPFHGLTSLIYVLAECAKILKEPFYLETGLSLAESIPLAEVTKEINPDMLGGIAGMLLALLHLREQKTSSTLEKLTLTLGKKLVALQQKESGGWLTPLSKRPLLGIGHGAAGIALSLLRLNYFEPDSIFYQAAVNGLAYERSQFLTAEQNWPNLQRNSAKPSFQKGWCGGAPGIGLSRLAILELAAAEKESLEVEIETAIKATISYLGPLAGHHLCCGESGRILFLSEAAHKLNRSTLRKEASEAALKMLHFYQENHSWKLHNIREQAILPTLMSGISGLGLAFLSAAFPGRVSKILTLS